MAEATHPTLVRALGRLDLTGLVINSVIGSGIFGLPLLLISLLGTWSLLAYVLAATAVAVIALCMAEVASRFREAGGVYLYARQAFGSFVGLQVGWIGWLVRIASAAANANLFVVYLAEIWSPATQPAIRFLLLTAIFLLLTVVNYRGVRQGAKVSDFFAAAKLLPLAVFGLVGLFFLRGENFFGHATAGGDWPQAMLLLVFAFGGFEAAMIPAGEMRDPRRDAPIALLAGLAVVAVTYTLVQTVVLGTLPPGTETDRPLAVAAGQFLGRAGGLLIAVGAMVSVSGLLSSSMLNSPRLTYAMAEHSDFPSPFAAVHPRFRTPHVSIVIYAVLCWGLAIWGSFEWNAVLSAVARLVTYLSTCAALIVLRQSGPEAAFRIPAGTVLSLAGIAFCVWLLLGMGKGELIILVVTMALATLTWLWSRRRPSRSSLSG